MSFAGFFLRDRAGMRWVLLLLAAAALVLLAGIGWQTLPDRLVSLETTADRITNTRTIEHDTTAGDGRTWFAGSSGTGGSGGSWSSGSAGGGSSGGGSSGFSSGSW